MNAPHDRDYEELFNLSYWRAVGTAVGNDAFAETTYSHFLAHPEVAAKFARYDPGKPIQMLRASLTLAASYYYNRQPTHLLAKYAELHNRRNFDIAPHLYQFWLDSVLRAVAAHDPQCDAQVLAAWRHILTPAVEFMQAHYAT